MSDCDLLVDALADRAPLGATLRAHVDRCASCRLLVAAGTSVDDDVEAVPPMSTALREATAAMRPVQPFAPWRRALAPAVAAAVVGLVGLSLVPRADLGAQPVPRIVAGVLGILLVLGVSVGALLHRGAFGVGAPPRTRWTAVVALLAGFEALNAWVTVPVRGSLHLAGVAAWQGRCFCALYGTIVAGLVAVVVFRVARRSAVVSPASAGALAGLAAGCAGVLGQHITCPVMDLDHTLFAHAAPLLLCAVAGSWAGRRWLAP